MKFLKFTKFIKFKKTKASNLNNLNIHNFGLNDRSLSVLFESEIENRIC